MHDESLLPAQNRIPLVATTSELTGEQGPVATRTHSVIRAWAEERRAEPATGEATSSGAASVEVNDGGAGIRFNFPGYSRFRPISWEEWFGNFDHHALMFVFDDRRSDDRPASTRFRIVKFSDWQPLIR